MNREFLRSRFSLLAVGIGLGWIARVVLGAPEPVVHPTKTIDRPIEISDEDVIDIPIIKPESKKEEASQFDSGLVPPIKLAIYSHELSSFDEQAHDSAAAFEAHGEKLCASGCAISRHPTGTLTKLNFKKLLKEFCNGELDETNEALEKLIFFGGQTRRLIESVGMDELDSERSEFLINQLAFSHAKISIRVTDENGEIRTWIEPTRVPFDRRHVFKMQTKDVQPLVTSGTVKRVGLNHIWTRL